MQKEKQRRRKIVGRGLIVLFSQACDLGPLLLLQREYLYASESSACYWIVLNNAVCELKECCLCFDFSLYTSVCEKLVDFL